MKKSLALAAIVAAAALAACGKKEPAPAPAPAPAADASATVDQAAPPANDIVTTESTDLVSPSYLGILGTYTKADKDRDISIADIDQGTGIGLLYGWQSKNNWGYEISGFIDTFETGDDLRTDFYKYSLGGDLVYSFGNRTHFTPFVLAGIGASYNDIYPNTGNTHKDGFDFFANAGVGFVTGPFTKLGQLRLRGEVRYLYDNYFDGYSDFRAGLGIEIPLFEERIAKVAAPVTETKVIETPTGLTDSDGDGIIDEKDKCPGTAAGTRVDGDGCPLEKIIALKGVTFEFNKTRLRPDAETILDWATEILKRYPDMKVEVAGHTDNIGSDSYNQELSEGRANAVRTYFVGKGIPESQLSAKGYGEAEPVADNESEEGRERNRRVELRILN